MRKWSLVLGLVIAAASFSAPSLGVPSTLPVLYTAPTFNLTDQNGASFSSEKLKGKVWVIDFLFTKCKHECPMMTNAMKNVQGHLKNAGPVEFVSITTDPSNDSPKVLDAFMTSYKIDRGNWSFLTGDKKVIVGIAKDGFKFPADEKKPTHSEKFALVDKDFKIRGYYESSSTEDMKRLEGDIRLLLK